MLTRLQVNGFKNLIDVTVRLGPFTCVAGPNGVGKSNLFDAIRFLSSLADHPLMEAAASVRGESSPSYRPEHLFHSVGDRRCDLMTFEADMLVPKEGEDDLGQPARAAITYLRYGLTLGLEEGAVHVREERLDYITKGASRSNISFPHTRAWRDSVVSGRRTSPFISTVTEGGKRTVLLHQDQGEGYQGGGRPRPHDARRLPRTVLSTASAAESATALLARREMQSWRELQLEPSALRMPDSVRARPSIRPNGAHLPATLARVAKVQHDQADAAVVARVANRLAELVEDVRAIRVDLDEKRELLTLMLRGHDGTEHEARALSDGTLRFLALAVLQEDPHALGLLCLEEPENGIHPQRIEAMLRLLEDTAVDVGEPVGTENPLRQIIVNTHSPAVIAQARDADVLIALPTRVRLDSVICDRPLFCPLPGTWRAKANPTLRTASRGDLLLLLNPIPRDQPDRSSRVIDRQDIAPMLPWDE